MGSQVKEAIPAKISRPEQGYVDSFAESISWFLSE
jgi:hypothetical protein